MLRRHCQKTVGSKCLWGIVLTDMHFRCSLFDKQHFGEESTLQHHLFEVLCDIGFFSENYSDRKVGGLGAKSICQLILVGKLFQVVYLLLFHGSFFLLGS